MLQQETSISIALLISIVAIACTLFNTFSGQESRQRENAESDKRRDVDIERNFVKINVKLDSFCETSNTMLRNQEKSSDAIKDLTNQVTKISEQISTLYHYKDEHEKRITNLESEISSNDR